MPKPSSPQSSTTEHSSALDQLIQAGLNPSQAQTYLHLLTAPQTTPPQLATAINITRTNAYEVLSQLEQLQLVTKDTSTAKTTYSAQSPSSLKQMILRQQKALKDRSDRLEGLLPSLLSTYRLTQEQPGVLYLEGLQGLTTLFDDIIRQKEELLIFPSAHDRDDPQSATAIDQQIARQIAAGIAVRTIYSEAERLSPEEIEQLASNNVAVRHFGTHLFPAQIMVYGDNIALSTYRQGVVTTIITNPEIAQTLRQLFNSIWENTTS